MPLELFKIVTMTSSGDALQAIWLITTGARESAFRNIKTIAECLADELINAAKGSSNRCAWVGVCLWAGTCAHVRWVWGRATTAAAAAAAGCPPANTPCLPIPRFPPPATPSRRRMRLSAWPRPTGKRLLRTHQNSRPPANNASAAAARSLRLVWCGCCPCGRLSNRRWCVWVV